MPGDAAEFALRAPLPTLQESPAPTPGSSPELRGGAGSYMASYAQCVGAQQQLQPLPQQDQQPQGQWQQPGGSCQPLVEHVLAQHSRLVASLHSAASCSSHHSPEHSVTGLVQSSCGDTDSLLCPNEFYELQDVGPDGAATPRAGGSSSGRSLSSFEFSRPRGSDALFESPASLGGRVVHG